MINISNRLKCIASFILNEKDIKGIIDVGCDHALLDIYLLENKEELNIIASDINAMPLEKARENLIKYFLINKVKLILADGVPEEAKLVDTVVISGMGMDTITQILERDIGNFNNINKLVISSNNKFPQLRERINSLGFTIKKEEIIYEDGKYYIVMLFTRGMAKYSQKELYFGPYLIKNKNEEFFNYYNYLKREKLQIAEELPEKYDDKHKLLEIELKMLTEELR